MNRSKNKIWLGIDPGRTTGLAAWQSGRPGKFLELKKTSLLHVMDFARKFRDQAQTESVDFELVIEQPKKIGAIYARHKAGWKKAMTPAEREKELNILLRIAKNIGQNIEQANMIISMCEMEEIKYTACPPVKSKKWNAVQFKLFTGLQKGYNEHVRDAARLVFGL